MVLLANWAQSLIDCNNSADFFRHKSLLGQVWTFCATASHRLLHQSLGYLFELAHVHRQLQSLGWGRESLDVSRYSNPSLAAPEPLKSVWAVACPRPFAILWVGQVQGNPVLSICCMCTEHDGLRCNLRAASGGSCCSPQHAPARIHSARMPHGPQQRQP